MDRKIYNYDGQSVYLEVTRYANNGMLAVIMFNINGEPYGAIIYVHPMALLSTWELCTTWKKLCRD